MSLWWLEPDWTSAVCPRCGTKIWPKGDPDWGLCYDCFTEAHRKDPEPQEPECDICGYKEAVDITNGYNVCSQECSDVAFARVQKNAPDQT